MSRLLPSIMLLVSSSFSASTNAQLPQFSDFPVPEAYHERPAPARLSSAFDHRFRAAITKGAEQGPNFAGHYTVVMWGCGTSCAQFVIVDAANGKVYDPPFKSVVGGDEKGSVRQWGIQFQLDSALLVAQGCPEEKDCATRYYKWNGEGLVLLTTAPVERFPEPSHVPPAITVKP